MSRSRRLLHFVSLGQPGGVERHLVEFVAQAARRIPGWAQAVLAAGAPVHPFLEAALDTAMAGHEKYLGPLKLPSRPAAVRRLAVRRTFGRLRPDAVMIWNRPVRSRPLLEAVTPASWLHWEHGSAWGAECERRQRAFYRRCPWIVANSQAARRLLALRWGRDERVEVCPNGLRPSLLPRQTPRASRTPGPLRLGMAGRIVSIKGGPLALHALALLRARGIEAELHVAGAGDRRADLEALGGRLGVSAAIIWHGLVQDMGTFYRDIDCLVHPAIHESFGLACLEAAAHARPVVTAAVDGLPEVVRHEATGLCVPPELPASDYPGLGGSLAGLPPHVYDPAADALSEPKLVSPEALADAVERLLHPGVLARFGGRGAAEAREKHDFRAHVESVMRVVERACDE